MSATAQSAAQSGSGSPKGPERYIVRTFETASHRDRVVALWKHCWEGTPQPAADLAPKCDWFYNSNPAGPALCYELVDTARNNASAGMAVITPRQFSFDGRDTTAAASCDFVVAPSHRTFYPAAKLQNVSLGETRERLGFVFGVPNARAQRFFERAKIGFHFRRPHFTAVVHAAPFLQRIVPAWLARPAGALIDLGLRLQDALRGVTRPVVQGEWLDDVDERFDDLWLRARSPGRCIGVRDRAFLHWRFVCQPGRRHRILAVTSANDSSRLIGYFVTEIDEGVLAVRDVLIVGTPAERVAAWLCLKRNARDLDVRSVACHISADEATFDGLRRSGFRDRGQTIAVIDPGSAMAQDARIFNGSFWYLTEADEDI